MSDRRQQIEAALMQLAPLLPSKDRAEVVEHALWSKGLRRASAMNAARLSLIAYVRHNFTDYDQMLREGYSKEEARYFCGDNLSKVLGEFGCRGWPSGLCS
jgi:hypothetical protein